MLVVFLTFKDHIIFSPVCYLTGVNLLKPQPLTDWMWKQIKWTCNMFYDEKKLNDLLTECKICDFNNMHTVFNFTIITWLQQWFMKIVLLYHKKGLAITLTCTYFGYMQTYVWHVGVTTAFLHMNGSSIQFIWGQKCNIFHKSIFWHLCYFVIG